MDKEIRQLLESLHLENIGLPAEDKKTEGPSGGLIAGLSLLVCIALGFGLGYWWFTAPTKRTILLYPQDTSFHTPPTPLPLREEWKDKAEPFPSTQPTLSPKHLDFVIQANARQKVLDLIQKDIEHSLSSLSHSPNFREGLALASSVSRYLSTERKLSADLFHTAKELSADPAALHTTLSCLGIGDTLHDYAKQLSAARESENRNNAYIQSIGQSPSLVDLSKQLRAALLLLQKAAENPYFYKDIASLRQALLQATSDRVFALTRTASSTRPTDEERRSLAALQTLLPAIPESIWQKFDPTRAPIVSTSLELWHENLLSEKTYFVSTTRALFSPDIVLFEAVKAPSTEAP